MAIKKKTYTMNDLVEQDLKQKKYVCQKMAEINCTLCKCQKKSFTLSGRNTPRRIKD